ncbi:MAG: DUF4338 domain-containing protein [Sulfitobacter sp.]|nr:DUF4338 domain-containing protein [Sulfitobacter sp.]
MDQVMVTIRGRRFSPDVGLIEQLLAENPGWGRSRLSVKLCELWDWRGSNGQLKDMACRNLLLRLEKAGQIGLPPRQRKSPNGYLNRSPVSVPHHTEPIERALKDLTPLQITCVVNASEQDRLFRCLLSSYHYLGLRNTVGENMKYLVHSREGRPLACLLFGAPAWKCGARDAWIGWRAPARERNLPYVANNTRFLVLPWVAVPYLASHLLSGIARRIQGDWTAKYGHSLYCLETFVDHSRYRGVCYRAANWQLVGQSTGRSRNDRHHRLSVPTKDLYLYPLERDFRRRLCDDT